ncbi:MAG: hypothetical protein KJ692_11480 [Verrucomicrobia bacterium]|nr:hypothetical protein [Verrucomicrobiota bacterium]
MEQATQKSKWVTDILEDWDKVLSDSTVSKQLEKELRRSFRAKLKTLNKINVDNLSGWQREWIKWNIESMQAIINSASDKAEPEEETKPPWLKTVEIEFAKTETPTVTFRALKHKSPIFSDVVILGQLVGHEYAAWHQDNPGMAAAIERLLPEYRIIIEATVAYQRQKRIKYVRKIMAIAGQQSFKDACSFFKGFSMAVQKGSITETGQPAGETSTTKIYGMLVMHQNFIPRLQSVNELYEWLQYMLGKSLIDEIKGFKRIEKICERIGLRFRPPGRPEIRQ